MTIDDAMAFVRRHGAVLAAANGRLPNVAAAVAGEPIRGSWWAHAHGRRIFAVLQALSASPDVLVCRLADGKVTLVHRRLWPALVRIAERFEPGRLAQVQQVHTTSGKHVNREIPFPQWVPADVAEAARGVDEADALRLLAPVLDDGAGERGGASRAARPGARRPRTRGA
ncbi:MAG TPA: hypothetical protein VGC30_10220 [Dokdonella sp.]